MAGLCILDSCKEEMIGQYPVDNIPPQNVSNVIVNNLPGKVELTYDLPNETDLLYVKAVYTDARGETQEVRTSVFNNKMTIPGFGKKIKRQIDLVAVDRSRNQSEPLYIDIEPEDSPIYAAAAQMSVRESWGGFVMKWKNEMREQFIVKTFKLGEDNKFSELETFYSTEEAPTYSVRGQESEPTTFGFVVEDVYGNSSDTTRVTLTPMYEVELPYSTFTYLPLAPGFTYRKSNNGMDKLFDNVYGASADFYIASGGADRKSVV